MSNLRMKLLLAVLLGLTVLAAQDHLAFEVASVKVRSANSLLTMVGGAPSGPRLTLEAMSLADLVAWAYNVKPWLVAGAPPWANETRDRTTLNPEVRFDINAKAEGDAPRTVEEFRAMMQSLLADRFQLTARRETRTVPVYALVVDKGRQKFRESGSDATGIMRMSRGTLTASGGTMDQLVNFFSNSNGVDRPIVDRTGLAGHYDFALQWSVLGAGDASNASAPSVFTALQEQLGLKLEPQSAPMEFLVIDHAEMPTSN